MVKRWLGVAVIVAGLGGTVYAQNPFLPTQAHPGVMPEPVPYSQSMLPDPNSPVAAAPYNGGQQTAVGVPAPGCVPGAPQEVGNSLRADTPTAWDQEPAYDPGAIYVGVGLLSMTRQRLGHTPAAFLDNAAGADTGDPAPRNAPIFADFNDVSPRANYGVLATVGYHKGTSGLELNGFYLSENNSAKTAALPNGLDALFFNAPIGFEGDNGMWLQSDIIRVFQRTALGSGEAMYRWWLGADSSFSWGLGVRYLDIFERFGVYSGDDDLTVFDVNGNPDPRRQATYAVKSHNRLLAPQLGFEWNRELTCWLALTVIAKGAWGANFLDVETSLERGDGFVGFHRQRQDTIFSMLYEAGFFLNFRLMDNARLRAGYNLLWAADVAEAVDQLDFNLANPDGRNNTHGSILFHGPSVELSILF